MREILFRGKRLDDGEWIYGHYSWSDEMPKRGDVGHFIRCGLNTKYQVNPATVGQFTGLWDKNGQKIYEGDISREYDVDGDPIITVVIFRDGCFMLEDQDCKDAKLPLFEYLDGEEVIGDIYTTPELLEVIPKNAKG